MASQPPIQVINLEEDALALDGKRPEVTLAVGIVLRAEVIERRDRAQDGHLALGPEGDNAPSHHQHAPGQRAPELIVQVANAGGINKVGHWVTYELKTHVSGPRGGGL